MARAEFGPTGAVITPTEGPELAQTAVALEALGFSTLWVAGGPLASLDQVADVVRATDHVTVSTGILAVVRFSSDDVTALYDDLEASHPGRFVVGLGGAHGPDPIPTLEHYLDRLTTIPPSRRVLAALGPRMYRMAREHAGGAYPVAVTPQRTAEVRPRLGPDSTLAVDQLVSVTTDAAQGRQLGRARLGFLATMPAYQANFRRQGFTDEDIASLSDALIDALVPWGSVEAIAAHVQAQRDAGADHVAISLVSANDRPSIEEWRALAEAVLA
jgi:probable F420-dependent oxidoreductase